jgi:hypothetical protein
MLNFVFVFAALATAQPCLTPNATTPPDGQWLASPALNQDSSGNNKTLALIGAQGGITWISTEDMSFARFNGSSGLQIASGTDIPNIQTQDFAVSFWLRFPDANHTCSGCPLVGQRVGCSNTTNWLVWIRTEKQFLVRFEMRNSLDRLQVLDVSLDAILNDTQWHFLVAFREGTTLKFAVDGRIVGNASFSTISDLDQPRSRFAIGFWSSSCAGIDRRYFSGDFGDVRVFVGRLPGCLATLATAASTSEAQTSAEPTQTTPSVGKPTQTTTSGAQSVDAATSLASIGPMPTATEPPIGAIVGGVSAAVVALMLATLAGVCFHRRSRKAPLETKQAHVNESIYDKVRIESHYDEGNLNLPDNDRG